MRITTKGASIAALVLAAVISFALTVVALWLNRPATAGIAAALALSFILLCKLPIVESFEVLTLKVKLRHQVDEAGDLLRQIRSTAGVTSKLLYLQLGFMNRMGTVSWAQKRELLADVDKMLADIGTPASQIDDWKRPFMNLISRDLASVLWGAVEHVKAIRRKVAQEALEAYSRANGPLDPADSNYEALRDAVRPFVQRSMDLGDILQRPDMNDVATLTKDWIDPTLFDDAEVDALNEVRAEVIQHASGCWSEGTITEQAEVYLEAYGRRNDTRIRELLPSLPAA